MNTRLSSLLLCLLTVATASAQRGDGGISAEMLQQIRAAQTSRQADRAIANAIATNNIDDIQITTRFFDRFLRPDTRIDISPEPIAEVVVYCHRVVVTTSFVSIMMQVIQHGCALFYDGVVIADEETYCHIPCQH